MGTETRELPQELVEAVERVLAGVHSLSPTALLASLLDDPKAAAELAGAALSGSGWESVTAALAEQVNRAAVARGEAPPGMVRVPGDDAEHKPPWEYHYWLAPRGGR